MLYQIQRSALSLQQTAHVAGKLADQIALGEFVAVVEVHGAFKAVVQQSEDPHCRVNAAEHTGGFRHEIRLPALILRNDKVRRCVDIIDILFYGIFN